MTSALDKIRQDVLGAYTTMRYDAFLADADWDHVLSKSHIEYPYRGPNEDRNSRTSVLSDHGVTEDLSEEYSDVNKQFEEARQRSLNALKISFMKQRNTGLLTDEVVTVLRQAVDSVQNDNTSNQFVSVNQLKRSWKLFGLIPKFKNMIEHHLYANDEKAIRNPWRKRIMRKCHKAALSTWLEITMQVSGFEILCLSFYCVVQYSPSSLSLKQNQKKKHQR